MRDSPSSAQPTPTKRLQSASTSSLKSVPQLNQHERCPSCDRHFGPKAYDRHVEWCRERKARIQLTPANQAAKERLQARIKYQVPALKKSPLTIVREKYSQKSPLLGRSDMDVKSGPNNAKVVQKGKSFTSVDKSDREEIPFSRSQARMERIGDYGQDIKETKLDNRRQNSTETRSVKAVPSKIKSTIPTLSKDGQKNNQKKKSAEVDNCNINELNAEELFPEDNKMYEEYKKYEEMYLEERQKKSASRKHVPKPVDFGINLETFDGNTSAKPGYDSAYGSLKIAPKELENLSNLAQPKFCHECGTKYPVPSARFCIECGVKRLIL